MNNILWVRLRFVQPIGWTFCFNYIIKICFKKDHDMIEQNCIKQKCTFTEVFVLFQGMYSAETGDLCPSFLKLLTLHIIFNVLFISRKWQLHWHHANLEILPKHASEVCNRGDTILYLQQAPNEKSDANPNC